MFRNDLLRDKVAYVSGGTSGIGLGIATEFVRHGARVVVAGRDLSKAERAAAEIVRATGREAIGKSADVRDYDAVAASLQATEAAFGEIDIVVAGAAGNFPASAINLSSKGFRTVVEIDLIGTYNVFRAAFEHLHVPGASLMAITFGGAKRPFSFQIHPCAAKAGVNMVVQCLALEWGADGIRVNAISPGPIESTEGMGDRMSPTDARARMVSRLPLRRMGTITDVANTALFLGSELSGYVTGQIIECDGGLLLGESSDDALKIVPRSTD